MSKTLNDEVEALQQLILNVTRKYPSKAKVLRMAVRQSVAQMQYPYACPEVAAPACSVSVVFPANLKVIIANIAAAHMCSTNAAVGGMALIGCQILRNEFQNIQTITSDESKD